MTEPVVGVSLQRKKLQVMKAVQTLEKDGTNEFQRYKYVSEAQVVAVLRSAMCEAGLTVTPSISAPPTLAAMVSEKGKSMQEAVVGLDLTLHDVESGEWETTRSYGCGQDHGDKAIPKAITMANKYALLKLFLLSTYDDAEADDSVDKDPPARSKETAPRGKAADYAPWGGQVPPEAQKAATPSETPLRDAIEAVKTDAIATQLARALKLTVAQVREIYETAGGDMAKIREAMKEELAAQERGSEGGTND